MIFVNDMIKLKTLYLQNFQGSMTIVKDIKAPWSAVGTLEKLENGKWQQSFLNRKIPEFCSVVIIKVQCLGVVKFEFNF